MSDRTGTSNGGKNRLIVESLKELGLDKYIPNFCSQGFTDWASLGLDISEVRDSLNCIVKQEEARGDYNRLLQKWQELDHQDQIKHEAEQQAREDEEAKKNVSPIPLPDLKPGTELDLSSEFATLPDGELYKYPEFSIIQSTQDVVHPSSLERGDWIQLAGRNELIFGFKADSLFLISQDNKERKRPNLPAFKWRVPKNTYFYSPELQSEYGGSVSYSENSEALVSQGILSADAEFACPFASVAASYSRNSKFAESDSQKRIRMTAWWRLPRVRMYVDECTSLSPEFLEAVTTALSDKNPFVKLKEVFNLFGNLYAKQVVLGGQLYFTHTVEAKGNIVTSEIQETAAAAAKLKGGKLDGGASVSFTDGEGRKTDARTAAENSSWSCNGGDSTLNQSPSTWADSVKHPLNWAIILREEIRPIISRIPEESLRKEVESVWNYGRTVLWDGAPLPKEYSFPDLMGSRFMLVSASSGLPVVADPRNTKAFWGQKENMGSPDNNMTWRLYPTGGTSSPNMMGSAYYYLVAHRNGEGPPRDIPFTESGAKQISEWRINTFSNGLDRPPAIMGQILHTGNTLSVTQAVLIPSVKYRPEYPTSSVQWLIIPADPSGVRGINGFLLQSRGGGFLVAGKEGPQFSYNNKLKDLQTLPADQYAKSVWNLIPVESDARLQI